MTGTESEHMPDADRLRALLVGKKVVRAEIRDESPGNYDAGPTGYLTLSDGTVLKMWGNDGGCSCSAGCYPLAKLNGTDNAITNVKVDELPDGDDVGHLPCRTCGSTRCWEDDHDFRGYYRVFVWAEDKPDDPVLLASFEGSDGNGYYGGTGWWLTVQHEAAESES